VRGELDVDSREDGERLDETRSTIASTVGGVMTEEVGAVTGDLEVATRPRAEGIEVAVRYAGADEWYTIDGGPIKLDNVGGLSPSELRELHERVVRHLTTPGMIVDGNEEPTSLLGFSPTAGEG
jgi:hypothetical protein